MFLAFFMFTPKKIVRVYFGLFAASLFNPKWKAIPTYYKGTKVPQTG